MGVLIFIVVLVALILVHEFGHFVAAKIAKMRVDEFGIGYPPKIMGWKKGETEYTLNWLPFGGFVKIYGEDDSAGSPEKVKNSRSFVAKPHWVQALVLVAGIAMNLVFAYVLLTATLALGMPRALTAEEVAVTPDAALVISSVLPGSPADESGIKQGDLVRSVLSPRGTFASADAAEFTSFISEMEGEPLIMSLERDGEVFLTTSMAKEGVIAADPSRAALGVGIAVIGTVATPLYMAPIDGAVLTWEATKATAVGLVQFFGGLFTFTADLSQVSGPVGIAGAVGSASETSLVALLSLTALISINLALINLIPIPALDGGRLLFVIIETITRKPIPAGFAGALNMAGFALLILLMVVVTASDIFKLFA